MKKNMIMLLILMLWASPAAAQQAAEAQTPETRWRNSTPGSVQATGTYRWTATPVRENMSISSHPRAAHSTSNGLPSRNASRWNPIILNKKDYFGEVNYAYRDVVLFNMYTRGMYHNLDHFAFGPDDSTTPSPNLVDLNPNDQYAVENQLKRAFIRFKTSDFPFHLYADVTTLKRDGTVQQRFMRGFTGGLDLVSQSRDIDWNTTGGPDGSQQPLGTR